MYRAIHGLPFFFFKHSCSAFCQIAQSQRPDGDAHEPKHFYFQGFEHPADVAIFALVEDDFEPRIVFALAKHLRIFHAQKLAVTGPDPV